VTAQILTYAGPLVFALLVVGVVRWRPLAGFLIIVAILGIPASLVLWFLAAVGSKSSAAQMHLTTVYVWSVPASVLALLAAIVLYAVLGTDPRDKGDRWSLMGIATVILYLVGLALAQGLVPMVVGAGA
jgi:hypothetical protein